MIKMTKRKWQFISSLSVMTVFVTAFANLLIIAGIAFIVLIIAEWKLDQSDKHESK